MKNLLKTLQLLIILSLACAALQRVGAQSTWTGGDLPNGNLNWSDGLNWSGGAPGSSSAVTFNDGAYPLTTNTQGAVNNIVQSSTTVASLNYNNNGAANDFVTTQIPSTSVLTDSGNLTVGNAAVAVFTTFTGGGSLIAGNGTSTLAVQSTSGKATLDLSTLNTFVFNLGGAGGPITLGTSTQGSGQINLAGSSNNITATTFSLGNNNTGGSCTNNLGNGTNIINADTISMGIDKTVGIMQFLNNAGGGLKIADHTGTGRANISLGSVAGSGSTSATNTGTMSFNGGTVNILAGTLIVGNRGNRTISGGKGAAVGSLSFNRGIVDATTIIMATNSSGAPGYGTISVGNTGVLKIGTGGLLLSSSTSAVGAGNLIITNGGSVICSNNIYKGNSIGVGTIWISGSSLNMASLGGTIGASNGIPINNFDVTNSTLTLPVLGPNSPDVLVTSFNPDTATTTTINIGAMPSISSFPTLFPVIAYTAGSSGGNLTTDGILPNIALGTLPNTFGTFTGYLSNDVTTATIWLVVTNGPLVGNAQWGGGVNNQWDTTTLNWTNNGFAVAYQDGDFVTFNDQAHATTVNLVRTNKPGTLTFANNTLNYNLTGIGAISGPVQLVMNGSATNTLAETGGDNFSLGIQINNGGTIVLDDPNSGISGGVMISGGTTLQIGNNDANGTLPGGVLDDEGRLVYDRSDTVNLSVAIPGGGNLTQNGSGVLFLSASNTYSGNTTINAGTLALTNSGSIFFSGQVSAFAGTTFDVSGASGITALNTLNLSNAIVNVKVGYLQTNLIVSGLNMYGTANTINVKSLPPIAYYPATNALIYSSGGISGYNFVLGTLPAASPAYAGTIAKSADGNSVQLVLTSGPTGVRPSVTWSGADYLGSVNTNWSDALNWQTPGVPAAAEPVIFNDTADVGGSALSTVGGGISDLVPGNIDNIVDINLTNAALTYANSTSGSAYHNTQIASGKTLTINGSLTVDGSGGNVAILGTNATLLVNNPNSTTVINVENAGSPTLDMSGLDTFTATVNQIGVGFNTASIGSNVNGKWYLAATNRITTGVGNFSTSSALVVGGSSGATAGTGQLYLGETNSLYVDGIVLGLSTSTADLIEFNPTFTNNPVAYIRGIGGDSSRVTLWSLGDDTVNINNAQSGSGHVNDFTAGTLNALVGTLVVGQGSQGNEIQTALKATFNMGAGNLNVSTLDIGVSANGKTGGAGIGIMNVYGGSVVAGKINLEVGTVTNTSGTLVLSNATLVVSNGFTVGTINLAGLGATLSVSNSTVDVLNGAIGTTTTPLDQLYLGGATFQMSFNGANSDAIASTNVVAAGTTTIQLTSLTNVFAGNTYPVLSYGISGGADPYANLTLATLPAGFAGTLVDNPVTGIVGLHVTQSLFVQYPHITGISISGNALTLSATNGAESGPYSVYGTTNLMLPVSQWTFVFSNNFDGNGDINNYSTNVINPAVPHEFYLLEVP